MCDRNSDPSTYFVPEFPAFRLVPCDCPTCLPDAPTTCACGDTETVDLNMVDERTGHEQSVAVCATCGSDAP